MPVKISATFEGKCSICGKKAIVFTAGDDASHKAVTICKDCADGMGDRSLEDVVKEHGKKDEDAFDEGIKIQKHAVAG